MPLDWHEALLVAAAGLVLGLLLHKYLHPDRLFGGVAHTLVVTGDDAPYDQWAGDTLVTLRGQRFHTDPEHRAAVLEIVNHENQRAVLGNWHLDEGNHLVHRVTIPVDQFGRGWVFRHMVREVCAVGSAIAAIPHTHC